MCLAWVRKKILKSEDYSIFKPWNGQTNDHLVLFAIKFLSYPGVTIYSVFLILSTGIGFYCMVIISVMSF